MTLIFEVITVMCFSDIEVSKAGKQVLGMLELIAGTDMKMRRCTRFLSGTHMQYISVDSVYSGKLFNIYYKKFSINVNRHQFYILSMQFTMLIPIIIVIQARTNTYMYGYNIPILL